MAYTKTTWEDLPSEDTPITSENLQNIEDGIEELDTGKVNKTDIADNLTTNDATKVLSANMGRELKSLIDLIKPTVLYNGSSNGTITLSDSVINYEYIEIFFRNNDSQYSSVKVHQANNKNVSLLTCFITNNDYFIIKGAKVNISGNSIIKLAHGEFNAKVYGPIDWGNTTYITRVVGYK